MAWMSVEDALSQLLPQGRASRLRKGAPVLPPEPSRQGYRDGNATAHQELRLVMEQSSCFCAPSRKYSLY
jgi:hypothetical protein